MAEIDLGWIQIEKLKNNKHVITPSRTIGGIKQLQPKWFELDEDSYTRVVRRFSPLKVTNYLKKIEADSGKVFPYSYDTSSHWFYYCVIQAAPHQKINQSQNRYVRQLLRDCGFPRNGLSSAVLNKAPQRHPMELVEREKIDKVERLRRAILNNFKSMSYLKTRSEFKKIWLSQVADPVLRRFLIQHQDNLLKISNATYSQMQPSSQKIFLSFFIIRSLYGSDQEHVPHKVFCQKAEQILKISNELVIDGDTKTVVRDLVQKSSALRNPIWQNEADKAVANNRPLYKYFRIKAFLKILRQLEK